MSSALTILATIVSGTLVFVLGQVALKLWIDPVNELLKTIGAIAQARVELAGEIQTPGVLKSERYLEASHHLRKLSAQLHGYVFLLRPYELVANFFKLPNRKSVLEAARLLAGISNGVGATSEATP